jgi:hypothetical protein
MCQVFRTALSLALCIGGIVASPPGLAEDRVIQLAIQADPDMNAFEIENKFKTARASTIGFNYAEVTVDPIDPSSWALISAIVRRGILHAEAKPDDPRGVLVEPLRGQDGAWWLDLRDPDKFLDSLQLTVLDSDSRKETVEQYQPAPRTETAQPLRYHSPGSYILKLPKGRYPRAAVLTISTEGADGATLESEEVTIGWPDVGRCYLVTLKGVTGDERKLFESLKDPKKVGNAIKEIYPSKAELIVGTFRDLWADIDWGEKVVRLPYMLPVNANPKRLWLRFPLTDAEEAAVRADLDSRLAPEDGFKKLPSWLAANKLPPGRLLEPGTDSWVEVPIKTTGQSFDVSIPIDTAAWRRLLKEAPQKVGDRAILVWEFQNPTDPDDREAIKVAGERYQRERFGWWLTGLPKLPLD